MDPSFFAKMVYTGIGFLVGFGLAAVLLGPKILDLRAICRTQTEYIDQLHQIRSMHRRETENRRRQADKLFPTLINLEK